MIEFLTAEGEMPIRIHEKLENVPVGVSTVIGWFCYYNETEGQILLVDKKQSSRLAAIVTS